jgi:hypothetical protein
MRITPDTLLKIARETVNQRARSSRDLLSAYLCGSILEDEPLLGGVTDIDLVFVHNEAVVTEREIVRLTDDIHLDLLHHTRSDYRRARELRQHPGLGPTIFGCKILYDPQHFMDFTQASVRGQFHQPLNVLGRARRLAEMARQVWFELSNLAVPAGPDEVHLYLRSVQHAADAVASLSGPCLTERRFLRHFPARAEAVGHPGLYQGLLGLLGAAATSAEAFKAWLGAWEAAYSALPASAPPPRLHPARHAYYHKGFEALLDGERPQDALWPLLNTWTDLVRALPPGAQARGLWQAALESLGLLEKGFSQRLVALDAYLDTIEELLDEWARANGA